MEDQRTGPALTRRTFLAGSTAAMAAPSPVAAAGGYRLGVMATPYASLPFDEAMTRIRKLGYRYISPSPKHADGVVFSTELSSAERKAKLRRMKDLGVEPIMSLAGFGVEPTSAQGLEQYKARLDLCADFGIPVMIGGGPWYYRKFPNLPKRELDWQKEVTQFYAGFEQAVLHAEQIGVTIALKPHTGITARAKDCMQVVQRIVSPRLQICWDAGNVSFYEGIYPDPDLPDLAPHVKAVCIKDHLGLRSEHNFPVPGQGQVDHEEMFKILFSAGFDGPMGIERVDGRGGKVGPDQIDERLAAARAYLAPLLDRITVTEPRA